MAKISEINQVISATNSAATSEKNGYVTDYTPSIKDSINNVIEADYPVQINDGYGTINVTTGSSDRLVTLPDAAANIGRTLTIRKADADAGKLLINDGVSNVNHLAFQKGTITFTSNGIEWFVSVQAYEEGVPSFALQSSANLTNDGGSGYMPAEQYVKRIGNTCYISGVHQSAGLTQNVNDVLCRLSYNSLPYLFSDTTDINRNVGGVCKVGTGLAITGFFGKHLSGDDTRIQVIWLADTFNSSAINRIDIAGHYNIKEAL